MRLSTWVTALALSAVSLGAQAAYQALPDEGQVLKRCNPDNRPDSNKCRARGLPGIDGMSLIVTMTQPIVINEVVVGDLAEYVWQDQVDSRLYVFGLRVQVNAEAWDASGRSFNVNDVMRRTLEKPVLAIAYDMDAAVKPLLHAGRTAKGLGEYEDGRHPKRDNGWLDFRVDVNAADPDGVNSPLSPWLLVRMRAPKGIEENPFAIRLLNTDGAGDKEGVEIFLPGWQPVGVEIDDDDD